eukprot:11209714-Lingulodinium_polyedra.AAC.1
MASPATCPGLFCPRRNRAHPRACTPAYTCAWFSVVPEPSPAPQSFALLCRGMDSDPVGQRRDQPPQQHGA